jgi:hypothetical protein
VTNVVLANAVTAAVSTAIWSTHPSRPDVKATFAMSRFKRRLRRPPHEGYHPAQIDPEKSLVSYRECHGGEMSRSRRGVGPWHFR